MRAGQPCPGCGLMLADDAHRKSRTEQGLSSLKEYAQTLREILFHPSQFFQKMPQTGGMGRPLAFALITHWLAAAVGFIWMAAFGSLFNHPVNWLSSLGKITGLSGGGIIINDGIDYPGRGARWVELQDRLTDWFWGTSSIIADPFITLGAILFTAFLVYLGARLLVPRRVTLESAVRILSYGMAPSIIGSLPILGAGIAGFWILLASIAGAREVYQIGNTRALIVITFPKLIFLGLFLAMILTLFLFVFGLALHFL